MMKNKNPVMSAFMMLALALIAIFALLVRPARAKIDSSQTSLDEARSALSDIQTRVAAMTPEPGDTEFAELQQRIPADADSPGLFTQIGDLATNSGVTVETLSIGEPEPAESGIGGQFGFTVSASGPRASLDSFLDGLARLPRLTIVTTVNLSPQLAPDLIDAATDAPYGLTAEVRVLTSQTSSE